MPLDCDEENGQDIQTCTTEIAVEPLDAYGGAAATSEQELEEEGWITPRGAGNTDLWTLADS